MPDQPLPVEPLTTEAAPEMSRAVDVAYRSIREAILRGELPQGESIPEKELSDRIGVSRTPIRRALELLRSEGLVVLSGYRKNRVASFTAEDVEEIYRLRALLEGHAGRLAAPRIGDEVLERLAQLDAEMTAAVEDKGADAAADFAPRNNEFHALIVRAAGSARLERLLGSSLDIPFNMRGRTRDELGPSLRRGCTYHREILNALEAHDAERAETQLRAHILSLIRLEV